MRTIAQLFLPLALSVCAVPLVAQEISFTASVDRNSIAVGEQIRLTLTLSNAGDRFDAPDLGGLVVVGGPQFGSRMSSINGRMTVAVTKTWIITGTAPGKYTIGSSRVKVAQGTIQTAPITIEVVKGEQSSSGTESRQQRSNANIFVTVDLSKTKGYVGEQVMVAYTLYSRYGSLEPMDYDFPALSGFWSEEIDLGSIALNQVTTVNGIEYYKAVIKRQLLIPQRSGKLRIEPAKLTYRANVNWFGQGTKVEVVTNAVEFTSTALPPNAPTDFTGAVGELDMHVQADRTSVKANEAIEIVVRMSGRSNLKLLDAPKLDFPGDFEAYDPKVVDKISVTAGGMSGSREFQYTVIPRHEGHFDLGSITLSYFDTRSTTYRSLASDPLVIDVAVGEGGPAAGVQHPSKSDVVTLGEEVRYIRVGDLGLRPKGHFLFASLPWFAGMSAPALAFLFLFAWHRKRERDRSDVEGTRRKRADKLARTRLKDAREALEQGAREPFYAALSRSLQGYLSDKFILGVAELNSAELQKRFAAHPGGAELAEACSRLLSTCDMARFAPVDDKPRRELYEEAVQLIQRIEQTVRT